jgi:hypothetical protein
MNLERKIIIGLITSTDYIKQIAPVLKLDLFQSAAAGILAKWCMEYYEQFKKAPEKDIEIIYFEKVKHKKISEDLAEEIENDILPDLNEEYVSDPINIKALLSKTKKHFKERKLIQLNEQTQTLLDDGKLEEAEALIKDYKSVAEERMDINLSDESTLDVVSKAFSESETPIVQYPGALGKFWNHQFVRGGLIGLMAPEKRGKTFWLLDMTIRASRQGAKVAFFQAGDMTETQQILRMCIYLARKSNQDRYTGALWLPVKDCLRNQLDSCTLDERESMIGVLDGLDYTKDTIRQDIVLEDLIQSYKDNPEYSPCYNCDQYYKYRLGTPWIKEIHIKNALSKKEAQEKYSDFFINHPKQFKLSTHANGTLSIKGINDILNMWEVEDGFVPDLIAIDYADILAPPSRMEFRHQQNEIWKGLRSISQERNALVIAPTQADANSYEKNSLSLKNFSEDKRKYAHVTAMYGLNQDWKGREKNLGVMRINELVIREGAFDSSQHVYVLQKLQIGRPFLTSYF